MQSDISTEQVFRSPWPATIISLTFTAWTTHLFLLYSRLHWRVLFSPRTRDIDAQVRSELFGILSGLGWCRVGSVLALVCAIWALQCRPRWPGYVALWFALIAVLEAIIIM